MLMGHLHMVVRKVAAILGVAKMATESLSIAEPWRAKKSPISISICLAERNSVGLQVDSRLHGYRTETNGRDQMAA